MVIHDYKCPCCGLVEKDRIWTRSSDVQRYISCECGGRMEIMWSHIRGILDNDNPNLGYGRPWPTLGGMVIRDWAHKQRVLRERGLQEANDRVGGSLDLPNPTDDIPAGPTGLSKYSFAADSIEDLNNGIEAAEGNIAYDISQGKRFGESEG